MYSNKRVSEKLDIVRFTDCDDFSDSLFYKHCPINR